ncbi:hypothetical protein [Rickettsiella endosymbiont of Miltochrista miniata]|uniref:hypothetical protein n=1 Tax=Rickettsiella endosymbiont of Miltochrista miniata TaxID=3066239 RepID=UPI00313E4578
MIEEKKIREKRFVFERPIGGLRKLWFSQPGQRLTLTYAYSDTALQKPDYMDTIEIAVESFNQLGLANLRYAPKVMGTLPGNCPLDTLYLKEKYQNQIFFTRNSNESADEWGCGTRSSLLYSKTVKDFFGHPSSTANLSLPPFSMITCTTENNYFLRYGTGVIAHEIYHLFGIKHAHFSADNSNHILNINIPAPDVDDIYYDDTIPWDERLEKLQKFINIYPFSDILLTTPYTLISPFSLQHYRVQDLAPYLSFNTTRMEEILDSYNASTSQKKDYFYLVDKYAGYPVVRTYQDVFGLAKAIYSIAPDSLTGLAFDFPSYYLMEGIYISSQDQLKLTQMIEYLRAQEAFVYPILAQEKMSLTSYLNNHFSIDLIEQFKVVSLSPKFISCHLLPYDVSLSLILDRDCQLKGSSNATGIFSLEVMISNNITRLQRNVTLVVKEKMPVKNRVLLSNPGPQYLLFDNATSLDLIELCQAVAIPREKKLHCLLTETSTNTSLEHCHIELDNRTEDYNISVIFTQTEARKTCHIQIFNRQNRTAVNNVTAYAMPAIVVEDHPIAEALVNKQAPLGVSIADQPIMDKVFFQRLQHCSQLLTIPLLQGFFEGVIDACHIGHTRKTLLKFIPRATLLVLGYTSFLSCGMATLASLLTDFMRENSKDFVSSKLETCIKLLFFIVVTELEYAPSQLWKLSGQLEIFPETVSLLNKLFVQMALVPAFKTGAYLASQALMQCLMSSAEKRDTSEQQTLSPRSDFFSALSVARDTVFSRKILRPLTFFARPAANNQLSQIAEAYDVGRPLTAKTA